MAIFEILIDFQHLFLRSIKIVFIFTYPKIYIISSFKFSLFCLLHSIFMLRLFSFKQTLLLSMLLTEIDQPETANAEVESSEEFQEISADKVIQISI